MSGSDIRDDADRADRALRHRPPPRTEQVAPLPTHALHLMRPVARALYSKRYRIELHGARNVPTAGPVLLASNHGGYLDGPVLAAVAPRPVHGLVKVEMFTGWTGRFLVAMGQIPVSRMEVDAAAVRRCVRALRDGRVLGVFPEGRRGAGDVAQARRGLAYLALVSGAPVVPVAVLGTRLAGQSLHARAPRGSRVVVAFGRPQAVAHQPWPRRRDVVGSVTERLRSSLADHVAGVVAATGLALPGPAPDQVHEDVAVTGPLADVGTVDADDTGDSGAAR